MEIRNDKTILDIYKIVGEPDENGGTAKVWKAFHEEWNIYLALKHPKAQMVASAGGKENFRRECDMWIGLGHHPHIVPCFYVREVDNELIVFSEWCDGGSLENAITSGTVYKGTSKEQVRRAASIALQVMLGLRYAHKMGVTHKDIKPANIMLTSDGAARITDFGSASSREESCTYYFCSPEQGDHNISAISSKSDIFSWALSVVMLHCGESYWEFEVRDCIKYFGEHLPDFKIPMREEYIELIKSCLSENPDDRPDADAVIQRIREIYADILENDIALNYIDVEFAEETADSLNNAALSYLDIGEYEKSEKCWRKALMLQPAHPESTYNYNVYLWKNGRIFDSELNKRIRLLTSPLKQEFLKEINRCSGLKFINTLISRERFESYEPTDPFSEEYVLEPTGAVTTIRFSEDGDKILSSSEEDNCNKVWDIRNGKCLSLTSFSKFSESNSDEKWSAPAKVFDNMTLEGHIDDEMNSMLKDSETGRCIGTISNVNADAEYTFSEDGRMLAVPNFFNDIEVYQLPEQGVPKPFLCRFMPSEQMLEIKRKFTRLKSDFEEYFEDKDYEAAAEAVNEIAEMPMYGCSAECREMKKRLFPYCKRSGFRALLSKRFLCRVNRIRFSTDGQYYLKVDEAENGTMPESFISVYETESHKEKLYISPKHDGCHIWIHDAWFLPNGNIRFEAGTETIEENPKCETYSEEYSFATNEIRIISSVRDKAPERSTLPPELKKFCMESGYNIDACDVNPDCTILLAGNSNEFAVFDIDCDIEYDKEKANAFIQQKKEKPTFENVSDDKEDIAIMPENTKKTENQKYSFYGINDNNRFLVKMSEGKAEIVLNGLSKTMLKNPALTFEENRKMAKEHLDGFADNERPTKHTDMDVQLLIDVTAEEYDAMMGEIKRQSEYWDEKPELPAMTIFMHTLQREKTEQIISFTELGKKHGYDVLDINKYDINAFDDCNSFLPEMNAKVFHYFCRLNSIRLINPDCEFSMKVKGAMYWKANHRPDEIPDSPEMQQLICATDEEFDEMVRENARRSYYWHNSFDESFLTLFMRTLDPAENQAAEEAARNDNRFSDFVHKSAATERRHEYLPKLTDKVQEMREALLENVMGQDHAVHGFCEGIFNSEVLMQADEKRVRPRAVFTFAGPPGVGKTYLAEQAAKYLGRPFKRFDMTEYSGHDSHFGLIGFDYTWKNATSGQLTSYVSENPECVLLFDEIEKAHPQVIQIFYQMLDAGVVNDKFYSTKITGGDFTDEEAKKSKVSFKDTIIIFTTNAGRSLYEGEYGDNCAGVPTKTVLNALKTEINPLTRSTFFPTAIVSRIATGYPILFNNLKPHHLVRIVEKEIDRVQTLFKKQYGIKISADKETVMSLLYSEGGAVDARALRVRVELFFKNEFFKIASSDTVETSNILKYDFSAETDNLPAEVGKLFKRDTTPEILLYANRNFGEICQKYTDSFIFHVTSDIEEAIQLAGEKDISFAIIDIAKRSYNAERDRAAYEGTMLLSMAASGWKDGKKLFSTLRTRLPELPIYILESTMHLNDDIVTAFERAGARGKLVEPNMSGYADFENQLKVISDQLYMQRVANNLAAERKAVYFETAPKKQENEIKVMLRNFELRQTPDADDAADLMSEAEKPKERFDSVIGAKTAKEELKFFVDFLKNPKKFAAQGHRTPKGVLLYGKPGTGKTMLAKAVAGEAGITFIPTVASAFLKSLKGDGPAAVRELFQKARRYAPSIIFIDEVDTIANQRTGGSSSEESILNTLLAEMDGFAVDNKRPVFVLAATNFGIETGDGGIGVLDEAFARRFDRKIKIELPDKEERKQLISLLISKIEVHNVTEAAIENIASRSVGTSPAILTNIIETAKRMAFNAQKPVDDEILTEAYEVTKHGDKKSWGEETLKQTACHECGHAIINYLGGHTPSYLTIEARGNFGGYMECSEEEREAPVSTKTDLIWRIRAALGGRAAEIVCFGEDKGITTGVSSDIYSATHIAKLMITRYAMDEKLGLAYMSDDAAEKSPEVRERINEILSEQLSEAVRLISENRDKFDRLCEELLAKNRLTGNEIENIFNKGE